METTFIPMVAEELGARGYDVNVHEVQKVNGPRLAISIMPEHSGVSPTFYEAMFQDMSSQGFTISEMADQMIDMSKNLGHDFSSIQESLLDKNFLLGRAQLCVCNERWNRDFLANTPHEHIDGTDLSAYARVYVQEYGAIVPTYSHMDSAGISQDELLSRAKDNTARTYTVRSMAEVMSEISGMDLSGLAPDMAVLSNRDSAYGASVIADKASLDKAREMLGAEQVYILPSSVHEVLAVPASFTANPAELSEMIQAINSEQVMEEERLSDQPYLYDGNSLSLAQAQELERGRNR